MTYQDIDEQIKYSANYDVPGVEIEDYVPENLIKIYPYRAVYGRSNRPLVQPNAITYVRISNDAVDDFQHLKTDENGKKYIEMFYALKEDTKITNSSGLATFEDELRKVKQFSVLTNDYISQDTEKPDFFTVGKPFDSEYYRAGQQSVYYANDFQPTYQVVVNDLINDPSMSAFLMDDHSRVATATFLDTTEMTSTTSKSKIIFTEDLSLGNSPLNTEGRAGFTLNINNGALIHSVKANGVLEHTDALGNVLRNPNNDITDNALTTIGLELRNNFMTPVKMTPVNTKDKLEMFSDWHDYDVVLPLGVASQFSIPDSNGVVPGKRISEIILPYIKNSSRPLAPTFKTTVITTVPNIHANSANPDDRGRLLDGQTWTIPVFNGVGQFNNRVAFVSGDAMPTTKTPIRQIVDVAFETFPSLPTTPSNSGSGQYVFSEKAQDVSYTWYKATGKFGYNELTLFDMGGDTIDLKITVSWISTNVYNWYIPFNNTESMMLLEDMIQISAGYADNWTMMGRDADGKITANQRLGWLAWNISDMVNKAPQDMLDSVFESYMRRFPKITQDRDDKKLLRSLLCALSRYVYTSYSIGKGGNNFHEVYLPWFLELNGGINYWGNKLKVKVMTKTQQDTGAEDINVYFLPGVKIKTDWISGYVAEENDKKIDSFCDIKWIAKSQYFREKFSSKTDYESTSELKRPNVLNISDMKILSSDRKLTTTELDDSISPINKLPLPGDISTNSSEDLNYLFWTPTGAYEKIYLSKLDVDVTLDAGTKLSINLPTTFTGTKWTLETVKAYVKSITPYAIIGNWDISKGLDNATVQNFENNYISSFLNSYANTTAPINGRMAFDLDAYTYEQLTGLPRVHSSDRLAVVSKRDPYSGEDRFKYERRERWRGEWKAMGSGLSTQSNPEAYQRFGSIAWNGSGFWGDSRNTSGTYAELGKATLPDNGVYGNFRHAETRIRKIIAKQLKIDFENVFLPPSGTWWTSVYGYAFYISHSATFDYQIISQNITQPITITLTKKQNVSSFTFQNMPAIYDRNSWNDTLWNFGLIPTDNTDLVLDVRTLDTIKSINEIIITGIFLDKFQIKFNGNPTTYILDSLTKYDESITTQRIVFY